MDFEAQIQVSVVEGGYIIQVIDRESDEYKTFLFTDLTNALACIRQNILSYEGPLKKSEIPLKKKTKEGKLND